MQNAQDATVSAYQNILILGGAGSGKTTQLRSLHGRKFAYLFDPNALASLRGADIDYEEILPDAQDIDMSLKGFNKGSKNDAPPGKKPREPRAFVTWLEDFNAKYDAGFFATYDWLAFDSFTLFAQAMMDRILWLNNRYGQIEDLADYRVAGSKMTEIVRSIASLKINLFATGHTTSYQDEKTKRVIEQIQLPGKARNMLPLLFSNIWFLRQSADEKTGYTMLTRAEPRGFQEIRTTLSGLKPIEDITIKDFARPQEFGIGKLLADAKVRGKMQPIAPAPAIAPTTPSPTTAATASVASSEQQPTQ
jgi:hypothetical protein